MSIPSVFPAQAGIQGALGPRLRGDDDLEVVSGNDDLRVVRANDNLGVVR